MERLYIMKPNSKHLAFAFATTSVILAYLLWLKSTELSSLHARVSNPVSESVRKAVIAAPPAKKEPTAPQSQSPMTSEEANRIIKNKMDAEAAARLSDPLHNYARLRFSERQFENNYGDLLATLNLIPAKATQLKKLLLERELIKNDTYMEAGKLGLKKAATDEAVKMVTAETNFQISQLLEPDLTNQLASLESIMPAYSTMKLLFQPSMAFGGFPMDRAQSMKLANAMAEIGYFPSAPGYHDRIWQPVDPQSGLTPINQALVDKARDFLAPDQLEILKLYQKEQSAAQASASAGFK